MVKRQRTSPEEQEKEASPFTDGQRRELIDEAEELLARYWPLFTDAPGQCVPRTFCLLDAFHRAGIRAVLQAGGLQWPYVLPEDDDGVSPTHFSYMCDPAKLHFTSEEYARCGMPEMHVWVGLPETGEIVDTSVRFFPEHCRQLMHCEWRAPAPPEYLWARVRPEGVFYHVESRAIAFILKKLEYGTEIPFQDFIAHGGYPPGRLPQIAASTWCLLSEPGVR